MISISKAACLMEATLFVKSAHVVAQSIPVHVAWVHNDYGEDTTLNSNEDITGVVQVNCGECSCAVFKTDTSLVT